MSRVVDRDLGYRKVVKNLKAMGRKGGVSVLVGVRGKEGAEQVLIAAVNEFGSSDGRIPERSYLRSTVDENRDRYLKALEAASRAGEAQGPGTLTRELGKVAQVAVGDIQRKIRDLDTPPNAPSTIRKKGTDNPLIDTGRLRQSIDWEIER